MVGETCRLQVLCQLIIIISLAGHLGSAMRPVVALKPNWNKIFRGEPVEMSCNVESAEETSHLTYTWYKDNIWHWSGISMYTENAQVTDTGSYYCLVNGKYRSETITLNVTDPTFGPVLLQSPAYIYEGDEVPLRCHSPSRYPSGETIFYKDNQIIQRLASNDSYVIKSPDTSSHYGCSKQLSNVPHTYSDHTDISDTEVTGTISMTLKPGWNKIPVGDSITMTCHVFVTCFWFHNGKKVAEGKSHTITSAQIGHSGLYQCRTISGNSPTFTLEVSNDPVVLQVPIQVSKGRDMALRCYSRPEYTVHWTIYYKNNEMIYQSQGDVGGMITIQSYLAGPGTYRCEKGLSQNKFAVYMERTSLYVRELLTKPNITVTPDPVVEGDKMTLTCETSISPLRHATHVKFTFYRVSSGQSIQSPSNQYVVPSAQMNHTDKYWCAVSSSISVVKISQIFPVQIKGENQKEDYTTGNEIRVGLSACVLLMACCVLIHHMKNEVFKPSNDNNAV